MEGHPSTPGRSLRIMPPPGPPPSSSPASKLEGATVAAGSVVTHGVPAGMMAVGSPARIRPLPEEMRQG
ncbi:hypothetical protein J2T58_001178 [Methanocalculus alkaliphilus]|uniref:acyltransferase n=1 Tax=Methanocalculus alkaliphilus TaxID=768730 RepID=UPI00344FE57F|nr:hypothetical protein [Methanocalculus alkaliphilus]